MIFAKNFARNYEKKILLGTSDAWSMSHLSHQPRDQVYYIEDCRISSPPITKFPLSWFPLPWFPLMLLLAYQVAYERVNGGTSHWMSH